MLAEQIICYHELKGTWSPLVVVSRHRPACLVTPSPPPSFAARAGRVGAMSSASVDDAEATKVRAVDDAPRTHRAARLAAGMTETRIVLAPG